MVVLAWVVWRVEVIPTGGKSKGFPYFLLFRSGLIYVGISFIHSLIYQANRVTGNLNILHS